METFISFYFWWIAFFMAVHAIVICTREYPHHTTRNIGQDIFGFILTATFFVWLLLIRLGVIN